MNLHTAPDIKSLTRFNFSQMHMGVAVRITLFATDRSVAENAGRRAFDRIADLDRTMSDYLQTSELSLLVGRAGKGPVSVSSDLFRVLSLSLELARQSRGAFDVTAAPITALWRDAVRTGRRPDPERLADAVRRVGFGRVRLDVVHRTVDLREGTRLDLGGIGKGYACDEAVLALRTEGIDRCLVEAGGDLAASGAPPGRRGWSVAVPGLDESPFEISDQALSTSGDEFQSVDIDGVRHSHVLDPRTGRATVHGTQTTVIGPRGAVTDALATLAGVDRALAERLARSYGAKVFNLPRL